MLRIGITGQSGFVGRHLFNRLGLQPAKYVRIPFDDAYFRSQGALCKFVGQCDVIVHLAALNRHSDPQVLYETNLELVGKLISAMESERVTPHVLFSSSTQEESENEYGKSKREGRAMLERWAQRNDANFTGMVVPNVFGPFGRPDYNSFIATFAHKLTHGERPQVIRDASVRLIYVGTLVEHILEKIEDVANCSSSQIELDVVPFDFEKKVTDILRIFESYRDVYLKAGTIPDLKDRNEVNLFNTFRSYIDTGKLFPVKLVQHSDLRGIFVETIRLGVGGQVSFSTTKPGVTRGNHFHTRKIERFTVMKGKARIQLRRIGTEEVLNFYLDGREPAYVDMPVWYTHNITNIGDDELYTQFWINEWYDPDDGDTFFEPVESMEQNNDQ